MAAVLSVLPSQCSNLPISRLRRYDTNAERAGVNPCSVGIRGEFVGLRSSLSLPDACVFARKDVHCYILTVRRSSTAGRSPHRRVPLAITWPTPPCTLAVDPSPGSFSGNETALKLVERFSEIPVSSRMTEWILIRGRSLERLQVFPEDFIFDIGAASGSTVGCMTLEGHLDRSVDVNQHQRNLCLSS